MARQFIDGFEANQLDGWTVRSGVPTVVSASTYGLTGNYCMYLLDDQIDKILPSEISYPNPIYIAFKFNLSTNTVTYLFQFRKSATTIGSIRINSTTKKLEAYRGHSTALLATGTTTLTTSQVYLLEIKYIPHSSSGTFIVKLDGITEISIDGTGNTSATETSVDSIGFGYSSAVQTLQVDDVVIDNANWIGLTYIQGIVPSGAGSNTNWTPSAGSNYACVDEIPHNSDTDYVYTNSNDIVDTYAMGNLTGSISSIKCVQVHAIARREETSTPTKIGLAIKSGSTTDVKTGQNVPISSNYSFLHNIWEVDPDTSSAWTESGVNAMEAGMKSLA